jgi:hypothetical protein
LALFWATGCVPDQSDAPNPPTHDSGVDVRQDAGVDGGGDTNGESFGPPRDCDPLDPVRCSLPWPSNLYLQPDTSRQTGVELQFGSTTLPSSITGNSPSPHPYARLDGYGLGVPIMTVFANLDASGLPGRYEIPQSMSEDASILLYKVKAGGDLERVPYWAELDAYADDTPEEQLLFVRPAVILEEDARYIVAFRDLQTESGAPIESSEAFQRLKQGDVTPGSPLAERRARFEEVFQLLEGEGVVRESLTLAWDFRTASGEGLRGRMLEMRKQALAETGAEGPPLEYEASGVTTFAKTADGSDEPVDPHIGLEISGSFEVPHFMEAVPGSQEWQFHLDEDGNVAHNGTREARFLMRVPHSVLQGEPAGVVVYGHGLLQSRTEIRADVWSQLAERYNYIVIATDWTGMAKGDRSRALSATSNISLFQGVADRLHQGILEFLLLGRSASHHLPRMEALTSRNVTVQADETFYTGASQGGIYGQTVMALSGEFERGFLAVPGNNYSTLLQRSVGFSEFLKLMEAYYQTPATRAISIATMQLLWNGVDPVNYAHHIKRDPLVEGAPEKDVLLAPSKGDYQVAVVTNENLARSNSGIPVVTPWDEQRTPWRVPTESLPHDGSGIVLFDFGNPWPHRRNRPPLDDGDDPHDNLAEVDPAGELINSFLRDGEIVDICDGGPCTF